MTLRLGLDVSTGAADDPVAEAVRAEALGFDFVSASDHPLGAQPTRETWTMLTWVAARTERISVLSRVLAVPFRPVVLVAKMAETLQRLSGGRLLLGLGAGYNDAEFRGLGLPVPSPGAKIEALGEAVVLLRALWREPSVTYAGLHQRAEAAELAPKPDPAIPLWLGTFGPRALALTGRVADGWIPSLGELPRAELAGRRAAVRAAAEAAGRDPDTLTCALNVAVSLDPAGPPASPGVLAAASPAALTEELAAIVALGFSVLNLKPVGPGRAEQVERLGEEVLPVLRHR